MSKQSVLVVGATGATGRHVVKKLLDQGHRVKVIVRSEERMMDALSAACQEETPEAKDTTQDTDKLVVKEATLLDLSMEELKEQVRDSKAVVSCLGHNLSFQGMYGHPRKLLTDATKKLTQAIMACSADQKAATMPKFILMGSDGVAHPDDDPRPFSERLVLGLIRWFMPPHSDNEGAADYLYRELGTETSSKEEDTSAGCLEWCVVRPTDLVDGPTSEHVLHAKPVGSLFGGGTAKRANVAQCMVNLITQEPLWCEWKFKMPVLHDLVMNEESQQSRGLDETAMNGSQGEASTKQQ